MVFMAKTIMLLILGIDYLIGNSRAIIPLFSFSLGTIVFYSFFTEHFYSRVDNFRQIFNYSLSLVYFFSGLFVLIGYTLKDEERNGYFYFYILFCVIFLLISNYYVFRIKVINFRDNSQKLNELEIFLQVRNILISIEKKSLNRELMLNFLEYNMYNKKIEENFLNDENENFNLYYIIEKSLKRRMLLYKNSLLLKMLHFILLRNYLKNHKGAYLLLYQLNYDLQNNFIYASIDEKFFIYRTKKAIEDDSIDFRFDKNEISMRYQINTLIDLITNVSELYFSFWSLLLSSNQNREIKLINKMGSVIHKLINEIRYKFHEIENIKEKDKKIILLYGFYLRDILNDKEQAEHYLKIDLHKDNLISNQYKNKNDFIASSQFQFCIISLSRNSFGRIERISKEFSLKLGYYPNELIGKNIKILFPALLNDEIITFFENSFKDVYNYKGTKRFYYLKTKSKYIEPFPIETSIQFDEEHNYFLLCKLDILLLSNKKKETECHIITDKQLIINLFSSSSIHLLKLTSKFICNSIDISSLIKEFHDEIIKIVNKQENLENIKIISIKNAIMKHKFINQEKEITWSLNEKGFKMKVEEIKMNGKLIGYYFHFNYIDEKVEREYTIFHPSNTISKELFNNLTVKKPLIRGKTLKKETNDILKDSFFAEKIYIEGDFIPELEKEINYFPSKKNYYFNTTYNDKNDNIRTFFQKLYLDPRYRKNRTKSYKDTITIYSENIDSSSSESNSLSNNNSSYLDSSEVDSGFSDIQEIKEVKNENKEEIKKVEINEENNNINKDDGKSFKSFSPSKEGKKSKSSSKIINLIEIQDDNIYKIHYQNIYYFVYDFTKHSCEEVKLYQNKSKVEEILYDEKNITSSLKKNKKRFFQKNLSHDNLPNLKKENTNETREINKGTIEISHSTDFHKLNIFTFIWLFIILFYFIFLIIFGVFYFSFCISIRAKIYQTIKIHNSLSDLMQNSNRAFYYAYQLIMLQNTLFINFDSSRNELKEYSKKNLKDIYIQFKQLIDEINIYIYSISKENKLKIENYSLKMVSLSENLERNITQVKVINIIEEFIFAIYSFMNLNDYEITFSQRDFNFILSNYETLLLDDLKEFSDIFLDEYNKSRKQLNNYTILFFSLIYCVIFSSYYFQVKIISKIIEEQEKTADIFFKINPEYIMNAIKNCENFIELNQKDKNDPEHLVSNPHIQISQKETTELSSSFEELETKHLIDSKINFDLDLKQNSIKKKRLQKCNIKKTDNRYLLYFTIPIMIFSVCLIFLFINQINNYKYVYDLSTLYFLILNQKTFLVKYINYFRTMLCFYAHRETNEQIKNIYCILHTTLNLTLNFNQDIYNNIFNSLKNCEKDEIEIFNEITFGNICPFFENYTNQYNLSCEFFSDGILYYGIYSISIYSLQLINYLVNFLEETLNKGKEKGFNYDEIYYRSDHINELYPSDDNLIEEYKSLNPMLIINDEKSHYLSVIIEQAIKNSSNKLSTYLKNKMIITVKRIKRTIIYSALGLLWILILSTVIFLIPRIIHKNNEMIEEKNMLKIIPKNELEQILIQEDIK